MLSRQSTGDLCLTKWRDDCVFALMVLGLGSWSALSLALLALNVLDLLPAS